MHTLSPLGRIWLVQPVCPLARLCQRNRDVEYDLKEGLCLANHSRFAVFIISLSRWVLGFVFYKNLTIWSINLANLIMQIARDMNSRFIRANTTSFTHLIGICILFRHENFHNSLIYPLNYLFQKETRWCSYGTWWITQCYWWFK